MGLNQWICWLVGGSVGLIVGSSDGGSDGDFSWMGLPLVLVLVWSFGFGLVVCFWFGFDCLVLVWWWWHCFRVVALFDSGLIWFWFWFDGGLTVVALFWVFGSGGFLVLILDFDFGWILLSGGGWCDWVAGWWWWWWWWVVEREREIEIRERSEKYF